MKIVARTAPDKSHVLTRPSKWYLVLQGDLVVRQFCVGLGKFLPTGLVRAVCDGK